MIQAQERLAYAFQGAGLNNDGSRAITNYKADENVVWQKPVKEEEYRDVNKK